MTTPNPYRDSDGWYFYDQEGNEFGPFPTQEKAIRQLLRYIHWLNYGPTFWQRLWWPIRFSKFGMLVSEFIGA